MIATPAVAFRETAGNLSQLSATWGFHNGPARVVLACATCRSCRHGRFRRPHCLAAETAACMPASSVRLLELALVDLGEDDRADEDFSSRVRFAMAS